MCLTSRVLSASAFGVLGLKACATLHGKNGIFFKMSILLLLLLLLDCVCNLITGFYVDTIFHETSGLYSFGEEKDT